MVSPPEECIGPRRRLSFAGGSPHIEESDYIMKKLFAAAMAATMMSGAMAADSINIKTRLDHLSGTPLVAVISTLPSEITSITCDRWTMLGAASWKGHNNFTIPPGPAVAILDASSFNGFCAGKNSIIAHTDDGDFVGHLDRGDGNWDASTKLTFKP